MKVDPGAAPGQPQASGTDAGSSPAAGAYPLGRRTHSRSVHAPPQCHGLLQLATSIRLQCPDRGLVDRDHPLPRLGGAVSSRTSVTCRLSGNSPASWRTRRCERSWSNSSFTRAWRGALPHRREADRGSHVGFRQLRKIADDLPGSHPRGQVVQDVVDGDACADEARLSAPHSRPISIIDVRSISPKVTPAEPGGAQTGPSGSGRLKMPSHRELRHPLEPPGKAVPWSRVDHGCWRTSHWL